MSDSKDFNLENYTVKELKDYLNTNFCNGVSVQVALKAFEASKQPTKDWEIVSFRDKNSPHIFYNYDYESNSYIHSKYLKIDADLFSLEKMLKGMYSVEDEKIEIYEVRLMSDNLVFKVGEETNAGTIKSFSIADNRILVSFNERYKTACFLDCKGSKLEKVEPKLPLFTTEDGVEIFKTDLPILFGIRRQSVSFSIEPNLNGTCPSDWHYFTTKEAAEKYQLENKPISVSLKEIQEVYYGWQPLLNFFKSKINP